MKKIWFALGRISLIESMWALLKVNWYDIFYRYESCLVIYSTLFAEGLLSQWSGSHGYARKFFIMIWELGAMFIVFIYLCNFRSHLIKGVLEKPIKNFDQLVHNTSKKVHVSHRGSGTSIHNVGQLWSKLSNQDRMITHAGIKSVFFNNLFLYF